MLYAAPLPAGQLLGAKPVYNRMRAELMAGQYLDLLEQVRGGGSAERALRVARYKAAKYTVEAPLHLGAALAAGSPELMATYTAYGVPLGEAFQLRDDLLGVFGDPDVTGKPAGDDLREGKRTVLIAVAEERSSPSQRAALNRHLGDPHLDQSGVDDLRALITDTGADAHVEGLIDSRVAQARQALTGVPEPAGAVLESLTDAATRRVD
jgi:geranylgeranyl diphosphate synthase, type I